MASCTLGVDYPLPIVNDKQAMQAAKDRMYGLRKTAEAREEASGVQARHGSRKSGLPPSGQRRQANTQTQARRADKAPKVPSPQGDLFN
jgi:deoxyribodipyrimidine photo-lyase